MRIEDYIREYRAAKQLTQQELADACGLSKGYISMLENGKNPKTGQPIIPSIVSLKQIAAGTGIGFNELLAAIDDSQELSLADTHDDIFSLPGIEPPPRWVRKPLLGNIAYGLITIRLTEKQKKRRGQTAPLSLYIIVTLSSPHQTRR